MVRRRQQNVVLGVKRHQVHVASEHGLPVLHHVDVCRALFLGGINLQLNAVAGAIYGAVGAQEDLVRAGLGGKRHRAGRVVSLLVGGFNAQRGGRGCAAHMNYAHSGGIGGDGLLGGAGEINLQFRRRRFAVRVGGYQEHLVVEARN